MPDTINESGYLDKPYLEEDYLSGQIEQGKGFQVTQVIRDQAAVGQQAEMIVNDNAPTGMQSQMQIVDRLETLGMQCEMLLQDILSDTGMQADQVLSASPQAGMQATMEVLDQEALGFQVAQFIIDRLDLNGMQVEAQLLDQVELLGMQAKHDVLRHALHGKYLVDSEGYLEEPYLVEKMCAFQGMQVEMINKIEDPQGMQAEMVIRDQLISGMQALMKIVDRTKTTGMQVDQIAIQATGMQSTMVIYNTTQLRIMCEFPSRGTPALGGNNWTATSTESGFPASNLNTDIVEQRFQSAPGSAALVTLTCDTGLPQGVPVDTIAILNHNLTRSAQVQVQGSKDNFATSPDITFNMTVELNNMFYIAPEFPTLPGQNRQWRFIIQDSTNPEDQIKIGTIVFGASDIFSTAECFNNPITLGFKHFKDSIPTEGFTNVNNDRALKKFLRLNFEKINFFKGNYTILDDMAQFARTSLKCLIIPTPEFPSRFAVFAKLTDMPVPQHTSLGATEEYIDVDYEWDESL